MRMLEESLRRDDNVYFRAYDSTCGGKFPSAIVDRSKNAGVVLIRDLEGFFEKPDEETRADLLRPKLMARLRS